MSEMAVLIPLPRQIEMTFWSLYDLALSYLCPTGARRMDTGPTWSMPQRSDQGTLRSTDDYLKFIRNDDAWNRESAGHGQVRFRFEADGMVSQIPKEQRFDDILAQHLGENLKSFYQEAKEVFQFCLMKRPEPTKIERYGIGLYKTVLGIGNPPRT